MALVAETTVTCPSCGAAQRFRLVQSVDAQKDAAELQQLRDGTLNLFACPCGKSAQLAGRLVFTDAARGFFCQVCPGGDAQVDEAKAAFAQVKLPGTQRIVPTLNALVEKLKLLDAGLVDWAVELTKALLLASQGNAALNRVLLFERVDTAQRVLTWLLFDDDGRNPKLVHSPLEPYTRGLEAWQPFAPTGELLIDRRWAVETVAKIVAPSG